MSSVILLVAVFHLLEPATAVLFFSTGDPAYHTNAPTGMLTDSGWQFQGFWGVYLGTPIAPHYFITARHVGGRPGDRFWFQNNGYTAQAYYDNPASDLRIWRVCETFPSYAPLYTNDNEVGKALVVFGRGTRRGDEVRVAGILKGWQWGLVDGTQRWGENQVESIAQGEPRVGGLLRASFDAGGGANEAHLSVGDSGGAVFLNDGAGWKLAGINYSVDGPYNLTNTGPGFEAAIFDEGGLYTNSAGLWRLEADQAFDVPGAFYATRISEQLGWINDVLNQTIDDVPFVESAKQVAGPFSRDASATVDAEARRIFFEAPGNERVLSIVMVREASNPIDSPGRQLGNYPLLVRKWHKVDPSMVFCTAPRFASTP